jgi:predicted acetyltransferase
MENNNITLELMRVEQKSLLIQLMELHNYEFSVYEDAEINEYGYYGYEHIDDYWNEEGRFPYLIRVDGEIAGFALICPHCEYINGENSRCIGEFFVMLKYRRMGVGLYVASKLFDKHPGMWEVCYLRNNIPASKFWKNVVVNYTNNNYITCGTEKDNMIGFTFHN